MNTVFNNNQGLDLNKLLIKIETVALKNEIHKYYKIPLGFQFYVIWNHP